MAVPVLDTIMQKIAEASAKRDVAAIDRLSKAAKRAQELEAIQNQAAAELDSLLHSLADPDPVPRGDGPVEQPELLNPRNSIRVTIDWTSAGIARQRIVIEERKGSKSLVRFLTEIHSALGDPALEKLCHLRISRGPLVSRNPQDDFVNRGNGSVYMNHPIGRSGYFVITHNGTTEKIDAINSAAFILGLKDAVKAQRT